MADDPSRSRLVWFLLLVFWPDPWIIVSTVAIWLITGWPGCLWIGGVLLAISVTMEILCAVFFFFIGD